MRSSQQKNYEDTPKDRIITEEVINALQQAKVYWKETLSSTDMEFYYEFTLPTYWDYETREELIRPLFIKAGLIHKDDNPNRLKFFTKLESNFQWMHDKTDININPGNQYVICSLDLTAFSVSLDLVAAQYPPLTAIDSTCVPQLLKESHFEIKFGLDEFRASLMACLRIHCDTMPSAEFIDTMLEHYTEFKNVGSEKESPLLYLIFFFFFDRKKVVGSIETLYLTDRLKTYKLFTIGNTV